MLIATDYRIYPVLRATEAAHGGAPPELRTAGYKGIEDRDKHPVCAWRTTPGQLGAIEEEDLDNFDVGEQAATAEEMAEIDIADQMGIERTPPPSPPKRPNKVIDKAAGKQQGVARTGSTKQKTPYRKF